jgi:hypothetical protein
MALTPFATLEDLTARYGWLDESQQARAPQLLLDATALIMQAAASNGIDLSSPGDALAQSLVAVTCSVVMRALTAPSPGAKSYQQTAGPYSEMLSFEAPGGDLYLTSSERKRLGIGARKAAYVRIGGGLG